MDRVEAKWILLRKLVEYQRKTYAELRGLLDETICFEVVALSGTWYQLELMVVWDHKPDDVIRVLASIDDGGWRAFCPLSYGTLVSP
jgi:hypothetical protein